jgi:two-component system, NarL family, response regulator DesR
MRRVLIKVLVAEDMSMLRTALVRVLSDEADMSVVADTVCGRDVAAIAERSGAHVAVIGVDTATSPAMAMVSELRSRVPTCRVIARTSPTVPGSVAALLAADVPGLVAEHTPAKGLMAAIRRVAAGGSIIDTALAAAARTAGRNPLTARERQVLTIAATGVTALAIARELSLSPGTVRNYLSSALSKVGARTKIDAIRKAAGCGWL